MLASAKVPKRSALPERSPELQQMTLEAYYGGRNEVSRTGYIGAKTFAYDINSAYPAAIKKLPCALHTRWCEMSPPEVQRLQRDLKARRLVRDLFIADLAFEQSDDSIWGAFPFRTKDGFIRYPLNGSGVYWSPEVVAAANAGVKLQLHKGYIAQTFCDCRTFDWIEPLYRYRLDVGDHAKGYPIKLGLAALNGKFSQRVGAAPWHDRIASGLLMSIVRAQVFEAAASVPWDVMMIATDAIYSTRPLPRLQRTDNLGDWKLKELPDFFVVQSGFYWSPHNVEAIFKSRGIRRSIVAKHAPDFIREWKRFINEFTEDDKIFASSAPVVPIPVDIFIALRLALELRKRDVAIMRGSWQTELWRQSFRWDKQREGARRIGDFLVHFPIKGKTSDRSTCYDPELLTEFTGQALLLSAMPDFVKVVE
jgi:hypothetical protein